MTTYLTQSQAIAAIPGLSPSLLDAFLEADLVRPRALADRLMFRPADLARLALLCDLAEHFDLEGDALAVVVGLIDQLYLARQRLHAMAEAVAAEPQEMRSRVGARFVARLAV
jgi:chaperone modulatory protein CbpM